MHLKLIIIVSQSNKSIQIQIENHVFSKKCYIKTSQKDKWSKLYATLFILYLRI